MASPSHRQRGHYDIFPGSSGNYFNIDNVNFGFTSVKVTYSGGNFSLGNLDIERLDSPGNFVFTASNGALFTPTSTGTFDASFNNITSFTFQQTASGFYGVDNLTFTAPVPLPAAAPLFGAAVLALSAAGYGLKRKKAAASA